MKRIFGFFIRFIVICLIVWTLVWSGVKTWQGYTFEDGYSGYPYKYLTEDCSGAVCQNVFNSTNLAMDIGIILAASLILTWFSYRVKGKLY